MCCFCFFIVQVKYASQSVDIKYLKGQKAFISKSMADARERLDDLEAMKVFEGHHTTSSEADLDDEEFMENVDIDSDFFSSSDSDES